MEVNYDRVPIKIELIHSRVLWNLISFSDAFSSGLVNLTLLPCGSSYSLAMLETLEYSTPALMFNNSQMSLLHISCHGLLQKKQKNTRGPCSSGGHPPPEVVPCHLKLASTSSPVGLDFSHTALKFPPAGNGLTIFDTCLPLMHAGQGYFWILCFSPDEFVRLLSYLFNKLLLNTPLSCNISSTKMLILQLITVANWIFNAILFLQHICQSTCPQILSFLAGITYTVQYSLPLRAMQILNGLVIISLFNILIFCFFSRLIWN